MGFSYFYTMENISGENQAAKNIAFNDAFQVLHGKAHEFVTDKQEELLLNFGLEDYSDYALDESQNSIQFFHADGSPSLSFQYLLIGTWNRSDNTWTWACEANQPMQEDLEVIFNYGEFYGFEALTTRKWQATEKHAWAVGAVSAYLRGANGIFKLPFEDVDKFILLQKIQ